MFHRGIDITPWLEFPDFKVWAEKVIEGTDWTQDNRYGGKYRDLVFLFDHHKKMYQDTLRDEVIRHFFTPKSSEGSERIKALWDSLEYVYYQQNGHVVGLTARIDALYEMALTISMVTVNETAL